MQRAPPPIRSARPRPRRSRSPSTTPGRRCSARTGCNENARQDQLRSEAIKSQQKGVEDLSSDSQKAAQAAEATRLESALAGEEATAPGANTAQATADAAITGGGYGGDVYQEDFAKQLSDAMASAKDRTKALATMQSYGDSFGGLGVRNPILLGEAGAGIDEANFKRRGSLSAYGTEQAVDPMQISYSNPIADIASSFLGVGMQGVGTAAANGGVSSIFGAPKTPVIKAGFKATNPFAGMPGPGPYF